MIKKISLKNSIIETKIIIKNKSIADYLIKISKSKKKVFCVVDYKLKYFVNKLTYKDNLNFVYLKGGENIKTNRIYAEVCDELLSKNIDRESILVAIGGGTIGDLCGFISNTILRGVDFKLIPTTLLSQVDSSIGGKNGINSKYGKNLIGTFYHPSEVIIDPDILKTLPMRQIKSGYAEIIKHSLIKDFNFFSWLEKNYIRFFNLDMKIIERAIYKSINIKLYYVKKDPKENLKNNNSRAMLNFGHTFGHSLENFYSYSKKLNHGEAISIGMITEAAISNKLGFLKKDELNKIISHFKKVKLRLYDNNIKKDDILKNIIKDKKNLKNRVNIVLLKGIGNSFYKRDIEIDYLKKIIKSI